MKGFHKLYPDFWTAIKICYVILLLIVFGIGFYFVSMPKLNNEAVTTTIQTTSPTAVTTILPNTFVPSPNNYKLDYFTPTIPVWEFSVPTGYAVASPGDGTARTLSKNKFLVSSKEWSLLYLLDISEDIGDVDGDVKAGQPIIQLKSNVLLFGVAKNCDPLSDIFTCQFVDPMEYFEGRR